MAKEPLQNLPGCVAAAPTGPTVAITRLEKGWISIVAGLGLNDPADAALLRAMGLRPGVRIRVVRLGEPTIVEVLGAEACGCACASRIGLTRSLAEQVLVGAESPG
jgi:Fe2+ transport system protein FeoA